MDDKKFAPDVTSDLEEVKQLIQNIQFSCQKFDTKQVQKEVQEEISKIVVVLQKIEILILKASKQKKKRIERLKVFVDFLQLAVESLLQTIPNIHLATRIRTDIEKVVRRYEHPLFFGLISNRFIDAYRSPSTSVKVLFGLMSATIINVSITLGVISGLSIFVLGYMLTPTGRLIRATQSQIEILTSQQHQLERTNLLASRNIQNIAGSGSIVGSAIRNPALLANQTELNRLRRSEQLEKINQIKLLRQVLWAFSAGTLGSIISILIRIEEFQGRKYSDPLVPFLIGLFKPIIGASFGLLFLTLVNSEFIIISGISNTEAGAKKEYLLLSVCFVVGFSERLAKDAISKVEEAVGGKQTTIQSVQTNALLKETSDGLILERATQAKDTQIQQEAKLPAANDLSNTKK